MTENMRWVIGITVAVLGGAIAYAADWQRSQDEKLHDLDIMLEKQKLILKHQIELNEAIQQAPQSVSNSPAPVPAPYPPPQRYYTPPQQQQRWVW